MLNELSINEMNRIILDSINEGVFTVNQDWRLTFFNQAAEKIIGIPRHKALGRFCGDVFRASICREKCALRQTMESGQPVLNRAITIENAAGKRVPVSISTGILKDGSNNIIGGVETFRDLSLLEELRKELNGRHTFADIISKNHLMQDIFEVLPDVAESDCTVLIEGPTGSGKELVAKAIHNLSRRKGKPLVAVNCAALPDTLLESELFGYEAGAFTGASKSKPGRFARAQGGTLLLDEIGDISPALQVKLLRVLQEREYEPLGATGPVLSDARILAATNKDLAKLTEKGLFREDLYYRINVIKIKLPPLNRRREDIPLLVEHFIQRFNTLRNKDIHGISPEAMALLMQHDYPGNIRELENIVEHAFILCRGGLILPGHLPGYLSAASTVKSEPKNCTLEAMEIRLIHQALVQSKGNRTEAARELGIDKTTLWRKMKKYDLEVMGDET